MLSPTPQQKKRLERLAKILDGGDVALLTELDALETRLEDVAAQIPALKQAVVGEKGEKGERGERGERGPAGRDGKDSTVPGPRGPKGDRGESIVGPPGRDGKDGKDGKDGFIDEATVAYLENEIKRVEESIPDAIATKQTNFGFVIRDVVAGSGVSVDKSDPNRPVISVSDAASQSWITLATSWSTEPVLVDTVAAGDVYSYTLDGTTRYRLVPGTYDPTQDAFYSNFDGTNLTGLIISRG